jgi:hypothetical protein
MLCRPLDRVFEPQPTPDVYGGRASCRGRLTIELRSVGAEGAAAGSHPTVIADPSRVRRHHGPWVWRYIEPSPLPPQRL